MIITNVPTSHGTRIVRLILLDEPVNGVAGIGECCAMGCEWRFVVLAADVGWNGKEYDSKAIGAEIRRFAETHDHVKGSVNLRPEEPPQ